MSTKLPKPGGKIRDRNVTLGDGRATRLSDLSGKKGMILYFYPRDNTPGCTTEACEFQERLDPLAGRGYSVVGVSTDSEKSHTRFSEKHGLEFPLIVDADHRLSESCGAWAEKKSFGKTSQGIVRTTLILDRDLKVLKIYEKVKASGHASAVLADLEGME